MHKQCSSSIFQLKLWNPLHKEIALIWFTKTMEIVGTLFMKDKRLKTINCFCCNCYWSVISLELQLIISMLSIKNTKVLTTKVISLRFKEVRCTSWRYTDIITSLLVLHEEGTLASILVPLSASWESQG